MGNPATSRDSTKKPPGKWIDGLERAMPVSEAARRVLKIRLAAAVDLFEGVREDPGRDLDALRRARVATRRARASVDAFRVYLPKSASKRLRRTLKLMRYAAGEPRDLWLQRDALDARVGSGPHDPGLGYAMGRIEARRLEALEALRENRAGFDAGAFREDVERVLAGLKKGKASSRTLEEHAGETVARVEGALRDAIERAPRTTDDLHQMRLDIKRLRYTYELCRPCIEPARFRAVYSAAKASQDRLGAMNDLHVMILAVQAIASDGEHPRACGTSLVSLVESMAHERDLATDAFIAWWTDPSATEPAALRAGLGLEGTVASDSSTLHADRLGRSLETAIRSAADRVQSNGAAS